MNKLVLSLMCTLSFNSLAYELSQEDENYKMLLAFNSLEMTTVESENTKGEAGPLVAGAIGAIGGGTMSIASDIQAGNSINWTSAGINAGAGFVAGASGVWMGGVTGAIAGVGLGASAYGGMSSGCGSCHQK